MPSPLPAIPGSSDLRDGAWVSMVLGMKATTLPLPDLNDMRQMLRLACHLHDLPPMKRAAALMDGIGSLIHADWGAAWVGEQMPVPRWRTIETGRSGAGGGLGGGPIDADPAAALLSRSQRKRTPIVRFRDELVADALWNASADHRLRATADSIYSMHRESGALSLLAFYRSRAGPSWSERERGIIQLVHAQCARCVVVDLP